MNINSERLWNRLSELGQIGRTESGGITRLSFTETEKAAKEKLKGYFREAELHVWEDEIGNVFGRREGKDPDKPAILIGSHIDSVLNGGQFDGPAGVLSGVEVLQALHENGVFTNHPIEVVAFTDEEGARFSTGMLGSLALAGMLTLDELRQGKDQDGISIADAMKAIGYDPEAVPKAKRNPKMIKSYLELHIEQGKVLENANLPVGLVTGIVGVVWLKVTLFGEAGHAGTTPMHMRKDPMIAAAKIIQFAEENARKEESTVTTAGRVQAFPGGVNIIPAKVEFTLDIRDLSEQTLEKVIQEIKDYTSLVCEERHLTYNIELLHSLPAAMCSEDVKACIEEAIAEELGEVLHLPSGAGHDAMVMERITPMGMIFVRSKDGISHNPKEWSDQNDIGIGADVLYKAVLKLDEL
jgi:allantoate deiminase